MLTVTEAAEVRSDVTDLPSKKRVWGFRALVRQRIRKSASQVTESRRENADTPVTNALGRWFYLQPDPIGLMGGLNPYRYVMNDPVNATDRFGLWKGPPHRSLTMGAMTIVGTFTSSDIATAVVLNLYVDRLENALNDPDHYMPHSGNAAGGLVVAKMLDEAVRLELLGRHREAIEALGQGSHTLQDRFSHYEQAAGWGAHLAGAKCDNPAMRPEQYSAAMAASVKYFKSFLIRTGRAGFFEY